MTQCSLSKASTRAGRVDRRWNVSECTWDGRHSLCLGSHARAAGIQARLRAVAASRDGWTQQRAEVGSCLLGSLPSSGRRDGRAAPALGLGGSKCRLKSQAAARCVKLLAWHLLEARLPLNAWVEPDAASCLLVLSEQVRATDVSGGSKRLQESSEGCSRYCSRP